MNHRNIFIFLLLIFSSTTFAQSADTLEYSYGFEVSVDSLPKQNSALNKRIQEIIASSKCKCPGTAFFILTIEINGTASKVELPVNKNGDWDDNLVSLLENSTGWVPAYKNGQPIRTQFTFPLHVGTVITPECCYQQ